MHEYETIRRGRTMLQASRGVAPSDRTIAGYKATTKRLAQLARAMGGEELDGLIACAKRTMSASTWFSRRAALLYSFRLGAEKLMAEQDRAQRALKAVHAPAGSPQWDTWTALIAKMDAYLSAIERLQKEPGPPIGERRPRHSKRKDMRGLPEDWRERIISRLPSYRHAALVEAVTGCRPAELVAGVKLSIEGGSLVAVIEGAKVTEKSGQPWRRLSWPVDSDSPLVRMLVDEVRNGLEISRIGDAKTYSGAVRAAGARG